MSSDCSSIPEAHYFNDKYQYPSWFNRKKMIFHNKMLKRLKKLRFLHSRSSQYYESMNMKISTPSIIITALSGIASFLSTSQYVEQDAQNACGITVGVLASAASVCQAFAAACQYGAKCEAHRTVAEQYNQLIVKTKFEMEMPNEADFIDKLEKAILEVDAKCNYFVPQFIIKQWEKNEQKIARENSPNKTHINEDNLNIGIFRDDEYQDLNTQTLTKAFINKNKSCDHITINIDEKSSEKSYLLSKENEQKMTNTKSPVNNNIALVSDNGSINSQCHEMSEV